MIEDKGAYRVQPAPQPFSIRSESKVFNKEKGRNGGGMILNLERFEWPAPVVFLILAPLMHS